MITSASDVIPSDADKPLKGCVISACCNKNRKKSRQQEKLLAEMCAAKDLDLHVGPVSAFEDTVCICPARGLGHGISEL